MPKYDAYIISHNIYKYMNAKKITEAEVAKSLGLDSFTRKELINQTIKIDTELIDKLVGILGIPRRRLVRYNEFMYDEHRW